MLVRNRVKVVQELHAHASGYQATLAEQRSPNLL